jgi:hypothetical protein
MSQERKVDMGAALAELEKDELVARWQRHRMSCLKLAIKLDAAPEHAIEMAEAISVYILNGRPKD